MSKFMNYVSFSEAMKCQKLMDFQCLASNVGQFRHVFKYFSEQPELCSTLVCGKSLEFGTNEAFMLWIKNLIEGSTKIPTFFVYASMAASNTVIPPKGTNSGKLS